MSLDEQLDTNLWLDEPLYELCSALVRRRRQAVQLVHYWIVERRPWIGSVCGRLRNRGGRGRVGIRIHANGQKVHFGSTRSAYVHEEAELSYRFSG